MPVTKIRCPECDAALKSEDGFTAGEDVTCPKCDTAFAVPKPKAKAVLAETEEMDQPPKKKKKKAASSADDDAPRSYKNSPIRYVILGVLVLVMVVLGVMLILKKRTVEADTVNNDPPQNVPPPPIQPPPKFPTFPQPKVNPKQPGKQPGKPPSGGGLGGALVGGIDPLAPIFGSAPTPAQGKQIVAKYGAALVGSWVCETDGAKDEVAYLADGTFVASRTGTGAAKASGKYTVVGPAGSTGLKLKLETDSGPRTITVTFDGDALEHPTLEKGVTATFKRK
jgi:uncharacterized Zn finger protein (UPF0148 family)